jgi:hypothetical protein
MAPRPSTAVPLVTTATRLPRAAEVRRLVRIADDFVAGRGHAGRIRHREIALVREVLGRQQSRSCLREPAGDTRGKLRGCLCRTWLVRGALAGCPS